MAVNPNDYFGAAPKAQQKVNPDDYFGPPAPPPPPPKPGLWQRAKAAVSEFSSQPEGAPAAPPAADAGAFPMGRGLADLVTRDGAPQQPGAPAPAPAPMPALDAPGMSAADMLNNPPPKAEAAVPLLERPAPGYQPGLADLVEQSKAPQTRAAEAAARAPRAQARASTPAESLAMDAQELRNPVARGAVAGVAGLGKTGVGAVRLAADLLGQDGAAEFAAGAAGAASTVEQGAMQGLAGNEKLVADVTNSIMVSAPSLMLGLMGGPALRGLFAQSTLAEYNAGRDAGFSVPESLGRAAIMGTAEALGERFGFSEQIKLLKSVTQKLPQGEIAKVFGSLVAKEAPGEASTFTAQFLADKIGPAALQPNATWDDYLNGLAETMKVVMGQVAVMGGGPAVLNTTRNALARADQVSAIPAGQPAPPLPTEIIGEAVSRFDQLAAANGLDPEAAAAAKKAAAEQPADQAAGFLKRLAESFNRRGLFKRPVAPEDLGRMDVPVAPPAAEQPSAEPEGQPGAKLAQGAAVDTQADTEDYTGLASTIDEAAHQAATSPLNDLPEPTDAQKEAGNYKKGHARISGLEVSIENPKGSIRRSKADAPTPWQVEMPAHYGYIRGTEGNDGDHVDLFVGDKGDNGRFWVINQTKPDSPEFDEHKVITGVETAGQALDIYKGSFADRFGDKVFKSISREFTAAEIKAALPRMREPVEILAPESADVGQQPDVAATPGGAAGAGNERSPGAVGSSVDVGRVAADAAGAGPIVAGAAAPGGGQADAAGDGDAANASLTPRVVGRAGTTPKNTEDVTLAPRADGTAVVMLGKYEATNFDTGEAVVVPANATPEQVGEALKQAGALGRKTRFYPATDAAAPAEQPEGKSDGQPAASAPGAAAPDQTATPQAPAPAPEQPEGAATPAGVAPNSVEPAAEDPKAAERKLIEARKRVKVLEALLECLNG